MSAEGAKFDPKESRPRVILVPMFARPVPELKFRPGDLYFQQHKYKENILSCIFLMISAFGNMCAYTEQLLGLNVIFGILQQAFGLNGHFFADFAVFWIFAASFWA